jgi:membrane-bound metal-dependent hydrolase YbcI (DUF457 family)
MPSPVGHALAGAAIAWSIGGASDPGDNAEIRSSGEPGPARLALLCAGLGAAADLDLLVPFTHRTISHSLVAVAAVAIVTILVTGRVTGRVAWRVVLACAAAYASHLLLDWLAVDDTPPRGLQILWPFSHRWFISGLDLFRGTARRDLLSAASMRENVLALVQEIATLGPLALAAWLVRVKAAAGFAPQVTSGHHPAE